MRRLQKGDDVIVTAGKDKGRRGTVNKVTANGRVFVDGINLVKKHQKPNPNQGVQGGIIEQEASLDASNVMHFNPASGKGERIGVRKDDDGNNRRYFKSNNEWVGA